MRRHITYYIYMVAALLLAASCDKGSSTEEEPNIGEVRVGITTSIVNSVNECETRSESSKYYIYEELLPTSEELSLTIEGSYIDSESGTTEQLYELYESIEAYNSADEIDGEPCPPIIPAGDYTITLSDNRDMGEESSTNACFSGSETLTLYARDFEAVLNIELTLQNAIVAIETSEYFDNYFEGGAKLILSTEDGATLTYDSEDYDSSAVLFVSPNTTLYLEGSGTKQDPTASTDDTLAPTVSFSKSEIGTATAAMLTRVVVDASEAGGTKLTITLDDTITEISEESVELNPIQ